MNSLPNEAEIARLHREALSTVVGGLGRMDADKLAWLHLASETSVGVVSALCALSVRVGHLALVLRPPLPDEAPAPAQELVDVKTAADPAQAAAAQAAQEMVAQALATPVPAVTMLVQRAIQVLDPLEVNNANVRDALAYLREAFKFLKGGR